MNEVERIAELEDEGYFESVNMCHECGTFFMLKVDYLYRRDVKIVKFTYVCPHCNNVEIEFHSG